MNVASSCFPQRQRGATRRPWRGLAGVVAIARPLIAIVAALIAPDALAEIYNCTAKKAIPTYQNFPCEFDSLAASSAAPAAAVRASTGNDAAGNAGTPAATAGRHASRRHSTAAAVPRVGMTTAEVRAIWGDPIDTSKEEFVKGTIETWSYADSRSIQFDRKGRVTSINW